MSRKLPVVPEQASSLRSDGSRNYVHPADVSGRFQLRRKVVCGALIGIYLALPSIDVGGHPAVFLDVEHRRFFLFGLSFNAQDFWLAFFLFSGLGFALFVLTTIWGRVWCGYACPHTVLLEGVFRPIERWLEGPRADRIRRNAAPMSFDKFWRKATKHAVFVLVALLLSHFVLSYFVSLPSLFTVIRSSPAAHPEAFGWMAAMSLAIYVNFAWFREQLCLAVCPYGRLQSALIDNDSLVIGYDVTRGEPRGKARDPDAGDCVDCKRCVVVCPTGIDIRAGLQMECIGCAACIDACDEIMDKLGRNRGLVRYDSLNGFDGEPKRVLRPRLILYGFLGLLGVVVAGFAFRSHQPVEANLLRVGTPFVLADDQVRNMLTLHLVNKMSEEAAFELAVQDPDDGLQYVMPMSRVTLGSLAHQRVPIVVSRGRDQYGAADTVRIRVTSPSLVEPLVVEAPFVAPR